MPAPRLAAWLDSYRAGLRNGLDRAAETGYRFVQANAAGTELNPGEFGLSACRHLRKYVADLGLHLDALALDYPGVGLADPARAAERFDRLKSTVELAARLNVRRATVSLGGLDDPKAGPLARELLAAVADLADRTGIETAIRDPGGFSADDLEQVRRLACPQLRVALDTATDATSAGVTPLNVAELLGGVYLRDVRHTGGSFEEVPYGRGEIDFRELLAQVDAVGGEIPLIVRHDSPGGVDALRQGREYIESLLGRSGLR